MDDTGAWAGEAGVANNLYVTERGAPIIPSSIAIDIASSGDTINVEAGQYSENPDD